MRFGLDGDDALDVLHAEVAGGGVVGGCELFHHGTFGKGHVVLVGRDDVVRVLLRCLFYHGEERRGHLLSVDDEGATEDFVAAVFGVDLGKAEHLAVGELSSELLFHAVEIVYFGG